MLCAISVGSAKPQPKEHLMHNVDAVLCDGKCEQTTNPWKKPVQLARCPYGSKKTSSHKFYSWPDSYGISRVYQNGEHWNIAGKNRH